MTTLEGNPAVQLTENQMVMLQFYGTNPKAIPTVLCEVAPETEIELMNRRRPFNGALIVQPTKGCSLLDLIDDLQMHGFELVEAFRQERLDTKDELLANVYYMARFVFAMPATATVPVDYQSKQAEDLEALQQMCHDAYWCMQVFDNPECEEEDAGIMQGHRVLSLNLVAREPLVGGNGKVITIWQLDENGERIGDKPLPRQRNFTVRLAESVLTLA